MILDMRHSERGKTVGTVKRLVAQGLGSDKRWNTEDF